MIGRLVGNYRIVREIGSGGMGAVYEGTHKDISRRVAIKLLLSKHSADPQLASRFLMEARAVSIVDHPALVNIFEYGQTDSGQAYLVMEYLDGETLRQRLARSRNGLGVTALAVARQMAQALAATHAKQIVHRDLKPETVRSRRGGRTAVRGPVKQRAVDGAPCWPRGRQGSFAGARRRLQLCA
ncbi:MAG: serine/threonine-protein kinase [Polyangia bacterium]